MHILMRIAKTNSIVAIVIQSYILQFFAAHTKAALI